MALLTCVFCWIREMLTQCVYTYMQHVCMPLALFQGVYGMKTLFIVMYTQIYTNNLHTHRLVYSGCLHNRHETWEPHSLQGFLVVYQLKRVNEHFWCISIFKILIFAFLYTIRITQRNNPLPKNMYTLTQSLNLHTRSLSLCQTLSTSLILTPSHTLSQTLNTSLSSTSFQFLSHTLFLTHTQTLSLSLSSNSLLQTSPISECGIWSLNLLNLLALSTQD